MTTQWLVTREGRLLNAAHVKQIYLDEDGGVMAFMVGAQGQPVRHALFEQDLAMLGAMLLDGVPVVGVKGLDEVVPV